DVSTAKADANNAKVTELAVEAGKSIVSFVRTDNALPLPVQKDWLPLLPYTNELKDLNWYGLTVKGLNDGDYTVSIDGVAVAKFKKRMDKINEAQTDINKLAKPAARKFEIKPAQ